VAKAIDLSQGLKADCCVTIMVGLPSFLF